MDSREAYRYEPMLVKSDLVVRANAVKAKVTAAVMPSARITMSVWYRAVQTPTRMPSPIVNRLIKIMFLGNSCRAFSEKAVTKNHKNRESSTGTPRTQESLCTLCH